MKRLFGKAIFISLFIFTGLITNRICAQDYPLAPEVWSEPVRIDSFSQRFIGEACPSLSPNLDTLYFYKEGEIYRSVKLNDVWQTAVRLNSYVNNEVPTRSPSISKDGKRLYYSAWGGYGSWDIFYNDWDDLLKDWSPRKNMGPVINSAGIEYYLYEVSKDTIYTINTQWATLGLSSYAWNHNLNTWALIDSFYFHPELGHGDICGLSITKNRKKLYYGLRPWDNEVLDERGLELCVSYWDSLQKTWGDSYFLNINTRPFLPDSNIIDHIGGTDQYPWISEDGRVLFFQSDNDAGLEDSVDIPDLYVSYLLIDENGDSITTLHKKTTIYPKKTGLQQNYPNPFNPDTIIRYKLTEPSHVKLTVFDIGGSNIVTLKNENQKKGEYSIRFDAANFKLSSGIYFYCLQIEQYRPVSDRNIIQTKKMIYLR